MNDKPISSKREYYFKFGTHLKSFCLQRYGSVKKAAYSFQMSPALLSQYINGHKYPSRKLEETLRLEGFDMEQFDKIRADQELSHLVNNATDTAGLNWEQLKFLIVELKGLVKDKNSIIEQQKKVIHILDNRVRELSKSKF